MKHYLTTINDVIFKPRHFFANISHQGIKEPLKYLIFLSLFTQFLLVYTFLKSAKPISFDRFGIPMTVTPHLTLLSFILFYVLAIIGVVFYNFFRPAVTHFMVKLFNKHAKYKDTYKAIIYSNTPHYITVPFFLIIVALGFSAALLQKPFLLTLLIISIVFWLAAEAYSVYLHIYSLSKLQSISLFRSFLAVYVIPTLILMLMELIAFGTVLSIGLGSLKVVNGFTG